MTGQHGSGVQSVERAIAILKSFDLERPDRGVGELSRELGLHKSTVSRLMGTLERGGLLFRDPQTRRYRLGIDLIGLAAQVVSHMDLREVARSVLRQLSVTFQESVNLVILDIPSTTSGRRGSVVNLEQFVPLSRQVTNIGRVGRRMYPHCTAAGKVLLAYLPPDEVDRILPTDLESFTPHTITDRGQLRQELLRVCERGYATAQAELEEGLNAVAVPVHDHTRRVIAAASVAGPAYRVTPELFPQLAAHLMEARDIISERLGYRPD